MAIPQPDTHCRENKEVWKYDDQIEHQAAIETHASLLHSLIVSKKWHVGVVRHNHEWVMRLITALVERLVLLKMTYPGPE